MIAKVLTAGLLIMMFGIGLALLFNPKIGNADKDDGVRYLPNAPIAGSILISVVLYCLTQIAFVIQ